MTVSHKRFCATCIFLQDYFLGTKDTVFLMMIISAEELESLNRLNHTLAKSNASLVRSYMRKITVGNSSFSAGHGTTWLWACNAIFSGDHQDVVSVSKTASERYTPPPKRARGRA